MSGAAGRGRGKPPQGHRGRGLGGRPDAEGSAEGGPGAASESAALGTTCGKCLGPGPLRRGGVSSAREAAGGGAGWARGRRGSAAGRAGPPATALSPAARRSPAAGAVEHPGGGLAAGPGEAGGSLCLAGG